jgi:hypothetical protein
MVKQCTCEHAGQDELNGLHMRVFNKCNSGLRCTVCGKTISVTREDKKPVKKK